MRWKATAALLAVILFALYALPATGAPLCDLNNDGRIDAVDIGLVRQAFLRGPAGDVTGDLRTDARDIAIVRANVFTPTAPPVGALELDADEQAFLWLLTDYRAHPERWKPILDGQGRLVEPDRTIVLGPLSLSYRLTQAAQWMATDTSDYHYFGHNDRLGRDFGARAVSYWYEARYTWMAEVAALGAGPHGTGAELFRILTESPGHNAALIDPRYRSIGIGLDIDESTHPDPYWQTRRLYAAFSSGLDGWP